MAAPLSGEDPDPSDRSPAGPLYVPVRPGPAGYATRLFRTPPGDRTAVGFTSAARLSATLGAGQPWIRLAEPALRALVAPLGVATVTVDPQLTAPAPTRTRDTAPAPRLSGALRAPRAAAPRVAGAAQVPARSLRLG